MRSRLREYVLATLALGVCGCGGVKVYKVTKDNQDCLEGFRYYLSRPFVAVKKPFPLDGQDYYARGTVVRLPTGALAVSGIKGLPPELERLSPYLLPESPAPPPAPAAPGGVAAVPQAAPPDAGGQGNDAGKAKTGQSSDASRGDSGDSAKGASDKGTPDKGGAEVAPSNPVLLLNDLFDVVLLPDRTQQYAVQVKPSIAGTASVSLKFRDGWMLDSVDSAVDNTAVTNAIKDVLGKLIDLAGSFVPKPPGGGGNNNGNGSGNGNGDQSGTAKQALIEGTRVVLQVTVFHEAQPGLYPLLDAAEDAAGPPAVRHGMKGTITIPVALPSRPYTVVAFNYASRISVRVLPAFPDAAQNGTSTADTGGPAAGGGDTTPHPLPYLGTSACSAMTDVLREKDAADLGQGRVSRAFVEKDKLTIYVVGVEDAHIKPLRRAISDNLADFNESVEKRLKELREPALNLKFNSVSLDKDPEAVP